MCFDVYCMLQLLNLVDVIPSISPRRPRVFALPNCSNHEMEITPRIVSQKGGETTLTGPKTRSAS